MFYDTSFINALVLAGGINRVNLFPGYTPGYKALLPFRGKPLIEYTLAALRNTDSVREICIVGPVSRFRGVIAAADRYEFVNGRENLVENISVGLDFFRDSSVVLVTTSDLPLATPYAINNFLSRCKRVETRYEANIFWSMVPERNFSGPYVHVKKGFNRFKDFSVCHGNLLVITPSIVRNKSFTTRLERIYGARKSSIRAARAIGPLVGLGYLFGVHLFRLLTMAQFARLAAASFGVGIIPIVTGFPEIAVDIDEARDYRFIMDELDRRAEISGTRRAEQEEQQRANELNRKSTKS